MTSVEPRLYKGLQDYLPDQMAARQRIIDAVRATYELYGFVPLGTPAIEHLDVLVGTGGAEANQTTFRVTNPKEGDQELGLRFDLTVPLARVVSQYRELPKPFRRYQVSSVWRADKPDRGRYREFTQFDIDSVGVETEMADVEIISAMCDALGAINVGKFQVKFSSRKVLELLLKFAGLPAKLNTQREVKQGGATKLENIEVESTDVFRVLDKLDKLGIEKVRRELTTGYKDESGTFIPGLGLDASQVERIERFLAIKSDRRDGVLSLLGETFAGVEGASSEIEVLKRMSDRLGLLGYGDDRVAIDLSIARGLAYYTGPVFETVLLDAPQYGSVCSGGRYDELVMRFMGERLPATGASIGIDRLLAALVELERVKLRYATARVLVTTMDANLTDEYYKIAAELRRAGINTELYLGTAKGFGKQVKYADQSKVPLVIVMGSNEAASGMVTIKEMDQGRQEASRTSERAEWLRKRPGQVEVPRGDLVEAVKKLIGDLGEQTR
jgi:histidyl-tRNA synthetase